ncbi:MAG: ketol-acid reductoisomerase [Verrucomicrobia bacterium]|nr:MAG: ketol-acid reductoisomerase [Verrucomicrobiota bacterium]
MPAKIFTNKDAHLKHLKNKCCAVIGFGSQGHAQALNLKESGINIIVGLYPKSKSRSVASKLGFQVMDTAEAVKKADIIFLAVPDLKIASVFQTEVEPHLTEGKTILLGHGFAIHYKTISPKKEINVIMVAPKGPGNLVRRQFIKGEGVPALIAIHQDPSKNSKAVALAWAKGIGSTRAGVYETTFREETETDLFGEQTILCGGISALIHAGFETLIEHGYQPEIAYFEVLHELKLTVDLIHESGISGMRSSISETAKYGDVAVGPKIIDASVKKRMKQVLHHIQSGKFAQDWINEDQQGRKNYHTLLKKGEKHPIERVGKRLRTTIPWIKKNRGQVKNIDKSK